MGGRALWAALAVLVLGAGCNSPIQSTKIVEPDEATGGAAGAGAPTSAAQAAQGAYVPSEKPPPMLAENAVSGTVRGRVVETGHTLVLVEDVYGRRWWFQLAQSTLIYEEGQPASVLAVEEGVRVDATFENSGGRHYLKSANILERTPQ